MIPFNQEPEKLEISMQENGQHSFLRGIEFYESYTQGNDKMLLKDAIMFLHHGVELLMKQILVQHSEYLIFEDLKSIVTKQKDADKQGVGIFYISSPPKTISCEEAIKRVDALIKPPLLEPSLLTNLIELIRVRNQLEHYAITADREAVVRLLAEILDPLLTLFETELGLLMRPPAVQRVRVDIQNTMKEYQLIEQEVAHVVRQFRGQQVPGRLLNLEGSCTLPSFTQIHTEYRLPESRVRVDVLAEGEDSQWMIEVKRNSSVDSITLGLRQLNRYRESIKAVPWLIIFGEVREADRERAKHAGIMLTGTIEWQELKKLVQTT